RQLGPDDPTGLGQQRFPAALGGALPHRTDGDDHALPDRSGHHDPVPGAGPRPPTPGQVSPVTRTSPAAPSPYGPLLSVRSVDVGYRTGRRTQLTAVHDVTFDLYPGQSMALVGESGCGKTTLGLGLLRLLPR